MLNSFIQFIHNVYHQFKVFILNAKFSLMKHFLPSIAATAILINTTYIWIYIETKKLKTFPTLHMHKKTNIAPQSIIIGINICPIFIFTILYFKICQHCHHPLRYSQHHYGNLISQQSLLSLLIIIHNHNPR